MKKKHNQAKNATLTTPTRQSAAVRKAEPLQHELDALLALTSQGRLAAAAALAQTITELHPRHTLGWIAYADIMEKLGKSADALAARQEAVALAPTDPQLHARLGKTLRLLARPADAEACLRRALALKPDFPGALYELANVLGDLGRLEQAAACERQALCLEPSSAAGHSNLGTTLRALGRLDESEACCRRALAIQPDRVDAHVNLGTTLNDLGRHDDAEACFRMALQIDPGFAAAHFNLGATLDQLGRLNDAVASYQQAIRLSPDFLEAYCNLGATLNDLGHRDKALAAYRRALEIRPDHSAPLSNLLFLMNHGEHPAVECLVEAKRYGRKMAEYATGRFSSWQCADAAVRLRVGLVSGDFRQHSVGHFLEGVLATIDPERLELIAYPTQNQEDALTARIKPCFAEWTPLLGMGDEAAARRVHADGIHILVDLAGHTAHNRLPVFAWKPAPVQVSWLGYLGTTGIAEMDYVLADALTLPAQDEANFAEAVWRLPETYLCFTPPEFELDVNPLPALANGYVTFGSFNNLAKMNDAVVALWARILFAVPASRLFLKAPQLREAVVRNNVIQRFASHGIDPGRLSMKDHVPRAEYLLPHHAVDIALDPFPYPGITTTVESLWMGVPVLTLAGDRFPSRQGVGLLTNSGLPEWIAADPDDYVARAVAHAGDLARLAALRCKLRQQLRGSPLLDAERFARHFEDALHAMWQARRSA